MEKSKMPMTDALKKAQSKYKKAKTTSVLLQLNKTTEADIIEKLASVDSKMGYIKALIRADIAKSNKQNANEEQSI